MGEAAFVIWDTDNNGLVDSLELFAGLAVFADMKQEDKLRFVFDMMDFNEREELTQTDVALFIHSCLSAVLKVYSITADIDVMEIAEFVKRTFKDRVTIKDIIVTSKKAPEIVTFFDIIRA